MKPPQNYFGASTNGELLYNDQLTALAIGAGVQMVRTSVSWNAVEKSKGSYEWGSYDNAFNLLSSNHFDPLVLILYNPASAANTLC